jgi:hypothetical protein
MLRKLILCISAFFFAAIVSVVPKIVSATPSLADSDDFVITVKTDNPGTSTDTQFIIPTAGIDYDYNVDCDNDGINEITGATGDYTCDYASPGTYTIRIMDNTGEGTGFTQIIFDNHSDKA